MTYGFSSPDIAIKEQLRLQKLLSRPEINGVSIYTADVRIGCYSVHSPIQEVTREAQLQ
jgi:flagellar biosynthesis component FlhA